MILLLLIFILLLRIRVAFLYYGNALQIEYGFLWFNFTEDIVSAEDIKSSLKDKGEKKQAKKKKKSKPKDEKKSKGTQKPENLEDALQILLEAVTSFWARFKRYARLEKYILKINLGTGDPALTGILYGSLSGVVAALHEFAQSIKNRSKKEGCIYTEYVPDFYADRPDVAVEVGFSLRVWQILVCILIILKHYGRYKRLPTEIKNKTKGDTEDE